MNIYRLSIFTLLLTLCIQSTAIESKCQEDTNTTGSTNLSAYNEGYNLGVANPGKKLYMFSANKNICAKYAKECTKFNACKDGYSAGSSGEPATPPKENI